MSEIAVEKGLTLMELSYKAEKDHEIDKILDQKQIAIGKKSDNFIMDSRLGWHFIPKSYKIYLKCNLEEAARRIYNDKRPDEKENTSIETTKKNIQRRIKSENKRYKEYYGLNPRDEKNFDLVIDTTNITIEEVTTIIIKKLMI